MDLLPVSNALVGKEKGKGTGKGKGQSKIKEKENLKIDSMDPHRDLYEIVSVSLRPTHFLVKFTRRNNFSDYIYWKKSFLF